MAQVIGKEKGYLKGKWKQFMISAFIILILIFICWCILFIFNFPFYVKNFSWLGITISIGAYLAFRKFNFFEHRADQFYRGGKGEKIILKKLMGLPNEYFIFPDIETRRIGNIDFVVIGPTGIFTIEVKSHGGYVDFDGQELTLNGFPFKEKNILMQARHQVMSLRDQLKEKMNCEFSITPIIVFSNWKARMQFGRKPVTDNIFVIGKSWLNELITSQSKVNFDYQSIVERLKFEIEWQKNRKSTQ